MYDLPFLKSAVDAFWAGLRPFFIDAGVSCVPWELSRPSKLESHWLDQNLVLSQTCLYPLGTMLRDRVTVLATPHYDAPDCEGACYRNLVLMHKDRERPVSGISSSDVFAYNEEGSYSGYAAVSRMTASDGCSIGSPRTFFKSLRSSGGHLNSMEMVADRVADLCSVDCVTYALSKLYAADMLEELVVIARGPLAPGLPLITRRSVLHGEIDALRLGLKTFSKAPKTEGLRRAILWQGISCLDPLDYDNVLAACVN